MSQSREGHGSPHSTPGGGESYKHEGTPDTRLTTFSPDENSARSSKLLNQSLNLAAAATGQHHQILNFAVPAADSIHDDKATGTKIEKDPFVIVTTSVAPPKEPKLSPTASSFLPPPNSTLVTRGAVHSGLQAQGQPLNATKSNSNDVGQASAMGQEDQGEGSRFSSDLRLTRYLAIFSPNGPILPGHVDEYLARLSRIGSPCYGNSEIVNGGGNKVYLRLSNIRDAQNVHDNIHLCNPAWMAGYISALEYYQVANPGVVGHPISEGMILIMALLPALPDSAVNIPELESVIHSFFVRQGDIFAFQSLGLMDQPVWKALVEFSDIDVAVTVASKFNGIYFENSVQLVLTLIREDMSILAASGPLNGYSATRTAVKDVSNMLSNLTVSATPSQSQDPNSTGLSPLGRPGQSQLGVPLYANQYPVAYPTPVPAGPVRYVVDQASVRNRGIPAMSGPPIQMLGGIYNQPMMAYGPPALRGDYGMGRPLPMYGRPNDRRQNAMRISRGPYFNAAGHHNHVDVNRIRDGIDVRTTIMLRNIPNKVDQAMLKGIIDESSWGKYDFMYLRIDFANDCNVGYAFVNFVDPLDIIDFVNARANQRWNCFKSDKVAEVSYATIQGKDCLVQKFRNSSVMLEAPHYRPKLYFTSNGPRPELAGQEEPFPEPDNHSKMKRSCENAEHVGLFTPNSGQHFREEQRRRRSQYDRGTRLAALEEGEYDRYMPMRLMH